MCNIVCWLKTLTGTILWKVIILCGMVYQDPTEKQSAHFWFTFRMRYNVNRYRETCFCWFRVLSVPSSCFVRFFFFLSILKLLT